MPIGRRNGKNETGFFAPGVLAIVDPALVYIALVYIKVCTNEYGACLQNTSWYILAAFAEICGCFSFWAYLRLGKSWLWMVPGSFALLLFAITLTRIDSSLAGRAYAAYGGIYICCSLLWLWSVERTPPDRWDLLGAAICLVGAATIIFAPHPHG